MNELEEVDHAAMGATQIKEVFRDQGYLFIKAFFPREEVLDLRRTITDVLVGRGWGDFSQEALTPTYPAHQVGSKEFFACKADLMRLEEIHLWAYRSDLTALLNGLLEAEIFAHPMKMVRVSYPEKANFRDRLPAHQDAYYTRGDLSTLTVWMPLGDYAPDEGGLEVAHDSHRQGLFSVAKIEGWQGEGLFADVDDADFEWRVANYEVGDVLVMSPLTLHRARRNLSEKFRLSWDCRFCSKTGRISSDNLRTPHFPHIPGWEELSRGWKHRDLFSVPEMLTIDAPYQSLVHIMNECGNRSQSEF